MSFFLSFCMCFLKLFAIVVGVFLVVALGLCVLLVRDLNRILSATEEYEMNEKIDSFINLSVSSTDGSEERLSAKSHQSIALTP